MKTSGKFTILALLWFFTACEPDDTGTIATRSDEWQIISVKAWLIPEIKYDDDGIIVMHWKGKAESDLTGNLNLSLTHTAHDIHGFGSYDLKSGELNLWTDDQAHTLVATYTGHRYPINSDGHIIMKGNLLIGATTGKFENNKASLGLTIKFNPYSEQPAESEIQILGKLKVSATP